MTEATKDIRRAIVSAGVLRPKEAAKEMGVCTRTLYRYIEAGELAVVRYGRAVAIPRNAMIDFMADRLER